MDITPIILSCIILPFIINAAITLISRNSQTNSQNNLAPFECGFDPNSTSRQQFSLQFFLLLILFLVFDIEVGLVLATPIVINFNGSTLILVPITLFLGILTLGLFHEWNEGSLSWNPYN